jgi:hypothetical protein
MTAYFESVFYVAAVGVGALLIWAALAFIVFVVVARILEERNRKQANREFDAFQKSPEGKAHAKRMAETWGTKK